MSETGPGFSIDSDEFSIINLACLFYDRDIPNNAHGLRFALAALNTQHSKVQPPMSVRPKIIEAVAQQNPLVRAQAQTVASRIDAEDYQGAVAASNFLYFFGEADFRHSLGGAAIDLSLAAHQALADSIVDSYADTSRFLDHTGPEVYDAALAQAYQGDPHEAVLTFRGIIHNVVFDGSLGQLTRISQFDPYAVVPKPTDL